MSDRPKKLTVPMRPRDWEDLEALVIISGAPSNSEAMRAAVRADLSRRQREAEDRYQAEQSRKELLGRIAQGHEPQQEAS